MAAKEARHSRLQCQLQATWSSDTSSSSPFHRPICDFFGACFLQLENLSFGIDSAASTCTQQSLRSGAKSSQPVNQTIPKNNAYPSARPDGCDRGLLSGDATSGEAAERSICQTRPDQTLADANGQTLDAVLPLPGIES